MASHPPSLVPLYTTVSLQFFLLCVKNEGYTKYKYLKIMKHCCAKPSAQLPKHIKSLHDDTKHAVMKPETSMNWSNHKNVHSI